MVRQPRPQGGILRFLTIGLCGLVCTATALRADSPALAPRTAPAKQPGAIVPAIAEFSSPSSTAKRPPLFSSQQFQLTDFKSNRKPKGTPGKKAEEDPNDYLHVMKEGSSGRANRKEGAELIPLGHLPAAKQAEVREILKSVSFYRQLPTVAFDIEPSVYNYLINHPDVTVAIWRAMKISKVELWQTSREEYEADAGDGTVGTIEVLHRSKDKYVVLCQGEYKSPLISKPISAKSLVVLNCSFGRNAAGQPVVMHHAHLFVHFPSQTIDTVARIFSPLTVSMTDRSFSEVSVFLRLMSTAMARRPDWVESISRQMDGIPDQRREQLVKLAVHVAQEAEQRALKEMSLQNAASALSTHTAGNTEGTARLNGPSPRFSTQPGTTRQR